MAPGKASSTEYGALSRAPFLCLMLALREGVGALRPVVGEVPDRLQIIGLFNRIAEPTQIDSSLQKSPSGISVLAGGPD